MKRADLILNKANLFETASLLEKYDELLETPSFHSVKNWLYSILPNVVLNYIVEPCEIKACGSVSQKIVNLAKDAGLDAEVEDLMGHAAALIKVDEGTFRIDATHLQSLFPYHGSLRDFSREEREEDDGEYKRMKRFFEELKENPMKAVKIEFYENS